VFALCDDSPQAMIVASERALKSHTSRAEYNGTRCSTPFSLGNSKHRLGSAGAACNSPRHQVTGTWHGWQEAGSWKQVIMTSTHVPLILYALSESTCLLSVSDGTRWAHRISRARK
jgi:hypothetical protein